MTEKEKKYLSDILIAINLIESFIAETDSFDQYNSDIKTQSAIERQLGIIGEAATKYRKENTEDTLQNIQQIIGFRNRLVHAYDSIDNSIVWVIIKRYLQPLKEEIEQLL